MASTGTLFAKSAVDALEEVDVVARGAPRAVRAESESMVMASAGQYASQSLQAMQALFAVSGSAQGVQARKRAF